MRNAFPCTGTLHSVAKLLAAGGPLEMTLRLAQSILHRLADLLLDDWLVVPTPLNILVGWDDYPQNMEKTNKVPNHQPDDF